MRHATAIRVLPLFFALPLALACAGIRVETDRDPEADLSALESYAWLEGPLRERPRDESTAAVDPFTHNSLLDQRLRREIEAQLEALGFRPAERDEADFLLRYQVVSREGVESSPTVVHGGYGGYGSGHYLGGVGIYGGVSSYRQGTLVIDFIDPESERLAWRGWADRRSRGTHIDPDRLVAAVKHILGRFPRAE